MSADKHLLEAHNDGELALRAAGGCHHAFEELVRRYETRLFNFILRRVCEAADAEDIVQQAFLKAWQAIDRYDPRWQFSTWLHTIAIRVASNVHHQNKRRRTTAREAAELPQRPTVDPSKHCEHREACENIWAIADRVLEEEARLALWLHYADEMAPREIARVLDRSSVAVRVMLHRARKRLAAHLVEAPVSPGSAAEHLASVAATFSPRLVDADCKREAVS